MFGWLVDGGFTRGGGLIWNVPEFRGWALVFHENVSQDTRSLREFQKTSQECWQLDRDILWNAYWQGETEIVGDEHTSLFFFPPRSWDLSQCLLENTVCYRLSWEHSRTLTFTTFSGRTVTHFSVVQHFGWSNVPEPKCHGKLERKDIAGCLESDASTELEGRYKRDIV